jgi:hypothetical protein
VSGRRNHPTGALLPAAQLIALAGRLTAGDRQVCRLLADHQVLTTGLLALLLGTPPRTLQQRLTTLRVVDRFRPHPSVGAGSAPYHCLLGEAGAAVLAADASATVDRPGWDRGQLGGLGHANGRLTHLLAVNTVLGQLTHTARHRVGTRLVCWWPAGRCQAQWGRLITPDAYGRWQDPDGEVDFFLHHRPPNRQPTSPPSCWRAQRAGRGHRHHHPRAGVRRRSRPRSPAARGLTGQGLLVPVATANLACGPPTEAVWLPTSRPTGGRRYRLGALGRSDPWHPTRPATAATPAPRATNAAGPPPPG